MVLTNVYGVALTIRATLPHLLERGDGHVIVTSSIAGRRVLPGSLYSATKWAATAIGEALRAELRQMHDSNEIKVTLIEPGMTDTPFFDNRPGDWALSDDDIARAVMFAIEQPAGRRRQRDPDPADAAADLARRSRSAALLSSCPAGGDLEPRALVARPLAVLGLERRLREELAGAERLVLVSRPRLPPSMVSTNLVTGTSGTA